MSVDDFPDLRQDQIPAFVTQPNQLRRWKLCVGITRQVAGKDDWNFAMELYNGPLPTGEDADVAPPAAT